MQRSKRLGDDRGQLLALFAIVLVAVVGMVGLIIDGGGTFVQRRDQQNAADAAAMAAGYAKLNNADPTTAAQSVAALNGYTNGSNGTTVSVSIGTSTVTVVVAKPHVNSFAGVLGFPSWNVGASATVTTGIPNVAYGALPVIFNKKAFDNPNNRVAGSPISFGEPGLGNPDVPSTDTMFNWTVFCTANGNPCNGDSNTVDGLINTNGDQTNLDLSTLIGPLNAGSHTTLFSDLANHLGNIYPVAIVDDSGALLGWATFHLTGSSGGSTKAITGWFDTSTNNGDLTITPTGGTPTRVFGSYVVKLTD